MTGNERINIARQYIADNLMGEGKNFENELAEIGINLEELQGTAMSAVEGFVRGKMREMPDGMEIGMMDETDFLTFFVGSFLVGFVAGRWEENDEREMRGMMDA